MKIELILKNIENTSILIVYSRFNSLIVNSLVQGAKDCLRKHKIKEELIDLVAVPGAYEIPFAINNLLAKKKYQVVIALGCIIKGETHHDEMIINHLNSQLGSISVSKNIPLGMGILTVNDLQQGLERAGGKLGNKGWEAAEVALEMLLLNRFYF